MNLIILAASYLVLIVLIMVLLALLVSSNEKEMEDIEASDAILGPEEAEKHAIEIARAHVVKRKNIWPRWIIPRLVKNFRFIREVYHQLSSDVEKAFPTSPAAEWLLDNFYIIEEQVNEIKQNLSRKSYTRLPVLKSGRLKGYPRIYAIALELIAHTDGRLDEKNIISFIKSYQSQALLSIGEIWSLGIMLRIALIGNLRYISKNMLETQQQWHKAEVLADHIVKNINNGEEELIKIIEEHIGSFDSINPSMLEHLMQRLRKYGSKAGAIISCINKKLSEHNVSSEMIAAMEHQIQAARQISIGNSITSLKLVATMDWSDVFESLSHVENVLIHDPAGVYTQMDFESRDYYRKTIEKLARKYNTSEMLIAKKAVECAEEGTESIHLSPAANHVGYYLIGNGRKKLEEKIGYKLSGIKAIGALLKRHCAALYICSIALITALICVLFMCYAFRQNPSPSAAIILLAGIAVLIPASDIAVTLINFIVCHSNCPSILPKLDLSGGIPEDCSTMVIIPTLLPNEKRVGELLEQLEMHYLSNKEQNLYFALVGDFKDSVSEEMPEDKGIIEKGLEGVRKLNERYASEDKPIFFFFHRHRQLNEAHQKWMGWERKRGAIIEFNDLLLGSNDTSYSFVSTEPSKLPKVKYVITLDADTRLPIGAAKKLVGTLSHPMNRAVIDRQKGIVVEGYGILQPRIEINIVSANETYFSRIFAGHGGVDAYSAAVSDVYQDLFGEGIFTGKGIYELSTFQEILKDSIPENTVLSHDLLEGSYIRAGLVTDIELVDGYPAKYNSYAMRLHRWVRGDWQLFPWLAPRVRDRHGKLRQNPLSAISKWKIVDNMRRSLVAPSLLILTILGFSILPGNALVWLGFALLAIAFNAVIHLLRIIFSGEFRTVVPIKNFKVICGFKAMLYQSVLQLLFIPYQAYLMLDAVIRTLVRVLITHKNMLEWVTAADMEASLKNDSASFWRRMWVSPICGIAVLSLAVLFSEEAVAAAALTVLWVISPQVAYIISGKYKKRIPRVSDEDIIELRRLSRKTWRYFEDMVTEEDNYLPPDNYQEMPPNGIAHRSSPTNIGLYLASAVCARDLGYIGSVELGKRIDKTVTVIEKMDKWEGHLYNWYDTKSLKVLRPAYISTVDSGNYIGYLMVVEQALISYLEMPIVDLSLARGLKDTINLLNEDIKEADITIDTTPIDDFIAEGKADARSWMSLLAKIDSAIADMEMQNTIKKLPWGKRLEAMINSYKEEMSNLVPMIDVPLDKGKMQSIRVRELLQKSLGNVSLMELLDIYRNALSVIKEDLRDPGLKDMHQTLNLLVKKVQDALSYAESVTNLYRNLIDRIRNLIDAIKFTPLYDAKKQLFSIGYNIEEGRLTKSYYDLFVSEARQTSYIAIARGEVDKKHWFRLGRKLIMADDYRGIVSWTGTMFEYLMPLLIMRNYENTLLDETYSFAVRTQKAYGAKRKIPWGTSESAYYAFDRNLNYQYKAFGVPGLGLKRGLGKDMVVAPYATMLALPIDPEAAVANIRKLINEGMDGEYGLYEAIDYTPSRLRSGKKSNIVRNFMVHHQGMSLLALNNYLNNNIMQQRFHKNPIIRSAELLLQEKVPSKSVVAKEHRERYAPPRKATKDEGEVIRRFGVPDSELPNVHILSNGSYSVMVTNGGSGYSRNKEMAVTRWRENLRGNSGGMYIFVQNINSNTDWSATFEPYREVPEKYRVTFSPDKAEFIRKDGNIETRTEIIVSTEDNAEIRRVSLTNKSEHTRILEVTSYFEVVLAHPDADMAHPAFNNLFITTQFVHEYDCLIASRRPRSEKQKPVWAVHSVTVEGESIGQTQYETDRFKFIGRNGSIAKPYAMDVDRPLSNTVGPVLDPIMSLRKRVRVEPGQTVRLSFITGVAERKVDALAISEKYREPKAVDRAFELAWTRSQIESRYLDFKASEVELYYKMMPSILFAGPLRSKWAENIKKNKKAQPDLWPYGISGDVPIVLLDIGSNDELDMVYRLLKAHEFWKMKGISTDLVIMVREEPGYMQPLQDAVRAAVNASYLAHGGRGGVFVLNASEVPEEDITLLYAASRIIIKGNEGPIQEQIKVKGKRSYSPRLNTADKERNSASEKDEYVCACFDTSKLLFFNGTGGFSPDGKEYIIYLPKGHYTPAPWINVVSNGKFGFQVSEAGGGYTWSENSRENKLTPWSNDPVSDPHGEVFYVRNDENGDYWSITPGPIRGNADYIISHGFGYTTFEQTSHGIEHRLTEFVPMDDPVKVCITALRNVTAKTKNLSIMYYIRPVLGVHDAITAQYICTSVQKDTDAVIITNSFNSDFPGRIAFIDVSQKERYFTGDRMEFIGLHGTIEKPEAMNAEKLSGTVGAGLDPCGALQVKIVLEPGESKEIVFMLGQGKNEEEVKQIATKYKSVATAKIELERIKNYWNKKIKAIQVHTPDLSMDILLNGWLIYQVTSCRLWSRSAFYQSGGAYGFRDQLQDVMALVYIWSDHTRKQLLLHSEHQFVEGDVQHWWHPGKDKGIRTRYSDDLLWLPYVTADYIQNTGDWTVLDEVTAYLEDEPLAENEDERYAVPRISEQKSTLYEHCVRAIEISLKTGPNGIPLMGCGDWNDGMNTVGNKGRGESIWLGWFLYTVLKKFIPICQARGDHERAERYETAGAEIIRAIEENAWDGSWYRRAYFDDGKPLGSAQNSECRIDAIAQSWSVISGAAKPSRAEEAMKAVENYLIDNEEGIIKLLTPPFNDGDLEPGYIKGYVPGVRENGGQYTHGAVWTIMAFALMGNGDRAQELYHMINPINHSRTQIEAARYKVEPYVMAADVYAVHPNLGRGGWTWYTGAAGWMYRVGLEHILGIKKRADKLVIDPCIPRSWPEFTVEYTFGHSVYKIRISNPDKINKGVKQVKLDGVVQDDKEIRLADDGRQHEVEVVMG